MQPTLRICFSNQKATTDILMDYSSYQTIYFREQKGWCEKEGTRDQLWYEKYSTPVVCTLYVAEYRTIDFFLPSSLFLPNPIYHAQTFKVFFLISWFLTL